MAAELVAHRSDETPVTLREHITIEGGISFPCK